jgi:hypothetical protein
MVRSGARFRALRPLRQVGAPVSSMLHRERSFAGTESGRESSDWSPPEACIRRFACSRRAVKTLR